MVLSHDKIWRVLQDHPSRKSAGEMEIKQTAKNRQPISLSEQK